MKTTINQQVHDEQDPRDKTDQALSEIARYKLVKIRGSITLHFDGSGIIAKYSCTYEGK